MRAMLDDEGVDLGIVGVVPLTGALNSLPAGPGHREDLEREDSIAMRLGRIRRESDKAWVAVVDAGRRYDPLAEALLRERIPTFRTADTALRLLNVFAAARGRQGR